MTFNTKLPKLTAHTEAAAEYLPVAFLHMATAWPLQSQSLVSACQLPEPAVQKSSWLVMHLFLICWPCGAITAQVHLLQCDSVKSTLSLHKPPITSSHHGGCAHSRNGKDGWERVREEFVSLWNYQSKFKALHQQWNTADLQAVIQSGDESQNTNASAKPGFHFCTSTRTLYWQKN